MRPRAWLAWGGFAVLLALHLDFWRPQRPRLWFGWLPEELLWRLAWMALAWIYLARVMRAPGAEPEGDEA